MVTAIPESDLAWMLDQQSSSNAVDIAKRLLSDPTRRSLPANPSYENLDDLVPTLLVRRSHASRQGIVAYGLDALLSCLEKRKPNQKIIGQAYVTDQLFGKFYFDEQEGKLLGFTIIDQSQRDKTPGLTNTSTSEFIQRA